MLKKNENFNVLFISRGEENLGIEYLSSFLKDRHINTHLFFDPGFDDIFFLKQRKSQKKFTKLKKAISSFKPDLVALTSVTLTFGPIREMADIIKKEFNIPTVIGGVHATTLQDSMFELGCFDYICIGEGENALYELVKAIKGERDHNIPNIWYKKDDKLVRNAPAPLIRDLDCLPFPDKDLYYKEKVFSSRYTIMTSRGCPYRCSYCVNELYHRLYTRQPVIRRRSVDNVIEELLQARDRYNIKKVRFYDDVFTVNRPWLEEFYEKYRKNINIPFHCNISPQNIDADLLKLLTESGCKAVSMGVQSGSSRVREFIMERKMKNEEIIHAADMVRNAGIKLLTELIFAVPGETEEEMWQTVELNKRLRPHNTASFNFYPFPGVKLTDTCLKMGMLCRENYNNVIYGKKGFNTWNKISLLNHPHKEEANAIKQLIPIFSILPDRFLKLLKILVRKRYRWISKIFFYMGYPLFDTEEFKIKLKDYIRYIFYNFKVK